MESDRFFVKSLKLENFRCFENVELGPFDPHFNLLVGTNGAGKSSVLVALANLFRPLSSAFSGQQPPPIIGGSDVRNGAPATRVLPGGSLPFAGWSLSSSFCWNGEEYLALEAYQPIQHFQPPPQLFLAESNVKSTPIPGSFYDARVAQRRELLVFYGVRRKFQDLLGEQLLIPPLEWVEAGSIAKNLREWFRDQTLIALQEEKRGAPGEIRRSPLLIVQKAIREAIPDIEDIEYDGQAQDIIVNFKKLPRRSSFSGMSDGQRAVVGLVSDISRRAYLLNGIQYSLNTLELTTGMVLIDEIDLHLHPGWQRQIIGALKRVFPRIQFFATTHSPQVVGEARPTEIILLTSEGQKRPISSYGMDSNWLLECVMEAEGRDPEIARRIKGLFDAIDDDRIEEAKRIIAALRADIGNAPDIVGAESYIWRIEHHGDEAAE